MLIAGLKYVQFDDWRMLVMTAAVVILRVVVMLRAVVMSGPVWMLVVHRLEYSNEVNCLMEFQLILYKKEQTELHLSNSISFFFDDPLAGGFKFRTNTERRFLHFSFACSPESKKIISQSTVHY